MPAPPPPQKEPIPELVLDKKPPAVARQRQRSWPPYTRLLIVACLLILIAIGYGLHRDRHPDAVAEPNRQPTQRSGADG